MGFIVVVAFALRMAYCWYILGIREIAIPDKHPYGAETGAIAASIAAGRGFSSPVLGLASGPTAWLAPIYPYLLAGIFKLFGIFTFKSSVMIRSLDMAFSAFVCWPLYAIGKKVFGTTVGAASAWLWALLPAGIYYSVIWVWDTALAALCMTPALRRYTAHSRPKQIVVVAGIWRAVGIQRHGESLCVIAPPLPGTLGALAFAEGVASGCQACFGLSGHLSRRYNALDRSQLCRLP